MNRVPWQPVRVLFFTLALFAFGAAGPAQEGDKKSPDKGKAKADDAPSAEVTKLIRLHVRTFLKKEDADKDGKLSRKEFAVLFDRFDRDGDGSLDRKELADAIKSLVAAKDVNVDQRVITFMREHDVNKDGKFSKEEARVLFDGADADKDGLLDEDELVKAVARLVPPAPDAAPADTPRPGEPDAPVKKKTARLGRLIGLRVVAGADPLGKVIDVVVDEDGRVAYVIVQGQADLVAVPWGVVSLAGEQGLTVSARVSAEKLREVSFAQARYPDFTSERWVRSVQTVWGEQALRRPGPGAPAPKPGGSPEQKPPPKDKAPTKDKAPLRDKDRPAKQR